MRAGAVRGRRGDAAGAHRGRLHGGRPLRAVAGHQGRARSPAGVRDSGPQRLSHPKQVRVAGVAERQVCALAGMLSIYGNSLLRHDLICIHQINAVHNRNYILSWILSEAAAKPACKLQRMRHRVVDSRMKAE